jgi:iron only hydrogenase large subunit-like protein
VLTYAANQILGENVESVVFEAQKNPDLREAIIKNKAGDVVLKFAIANGFRNIQNLVQKMKRKRCDYDLVEIMACPSGCLNGGAQLRLVCLRYEINKVDAKFLTNLLVSFVLYLLCPIWTGLYVTGSGTVHEVSMII